MVFTRTVLSAMTVAVFLLLSFGPRALAPRAVSDIQPFSRQEVWRGGPRAERRVMIVTGYTSGPESTGKRPGDPSYGVCASGLKAGPGAVAADPSVPFGTRVYVPGYGWGVVVDRGGAIRGDRLDVYFEDLEDALEWGVRRVEVYMLR